MENPSAVVDRIRQFNRFYTVLIGTLNDHYLQSDYSLAGTRVLYELAASRECAAKELVEKLQVDKGYISRILKKFERGGLVTKKVSPEDRRSNIIRLTEKGCVEVRKMQKITNEQIAGIAAHLSAEECREVCRAMDTITEYLGPCGGTDSADSSCERE